MAKSKSTSTSSATPTPAPAPEETVADTAADTGAGEGTQEEEPTEENTAPPAPVEETQETPPVAEPVTTPETPEVIGDDVTKQVPTAPVVEVVAAVAEVAEAADVSVTDPVDGDDENVANLKIMLVALKAKLGGYGKSPEDFRLAAKQAATVTKFVIAHPKTNVLDLLLAFFAENKDGVCAAEHFMKGSTTLPANEEQQVGFLYGLFSDLANKRIVSINPSLVINILKKPEITNYYQRKVAGLKAAKA